MPSSSGSSKSELETVTVSQFVAGSRSVSTVPSLHSARMTSSPSALAVVAVTSTVKSPLEYDQLIVGADRAT